jgi:hypothetical protein
MFLSLVTWLVRSKLIFFQKEKLQNMRYVLIKDTYMFDTGSELLNNQKMKRFSVHMRLLENIVVLSPDS